MAQITALIGRVLQFLLLAERGMNEIPAQTPSSSLIVRPDQPLIGVLHQEDGQEVMRYFTEEESADATLGSTTPTDALRLAGAWSDLDWEEMEKGLDRIRHESPPSAPLEG